MSIQTLNVIYDLEQGITDLDSLRLKCIADQINLFIEIINDHYNNYDDHSFYEQDITRCVIDLNFSFKNKEDKQAILSFLLNTDKLNQTQKNDLLIRLI